METTQSTRRMEMALPLFKGLDLPRLLEGEENFNEGLSLSLRAKAAQDEGDPREAKDLQVASDRRFRAGLAGIVDVFGDAATAQTFRRLSAIARATEEELEMAETDSGFLAKLESRVSKQPFAASYQDALGFLSALRTCWASTPSSSAPAALNEMAAEGAGAAAGSPSGV